MDVFVILHASHNYSALPKQCTEVNAIAVLHWKDAQASFKLTLIAVVCSPVIAAPGSAWAAKPTQEAISARQGLHCCSYTTDSSVCIP